MVKEVSIHGWESKWEQTFKNTDGLFFSVSIWNVASYLIENIDYVLPQGRPLGPHPTMMLSEIIAKASTSTEVETRILRLAAPSAIKHLMGLAGQVAALLAGQKQKLDLKSLRRYLAKIVTVYDSPAFLIATKKLTLQLIKEKNSDESGLLSVIPYLVSALSSRYPESFIKDIPRKTFSEFFCKFLQGKNQ